LKQAVEMARLVTGDEIQHKKIIDEVARIIPDFSLGCTPPEMARMIHRVMERQMGPVDFYKRIKEDSNRKALALYPRLKEKVGRSADRLLTAVEVAIAGNVIDYAAKNTLNIEEELENLFREEFSVTGKTRFDYERFQNRLSRSGRILYLADNAGEVVFDRVLLEEIPAEKKILFAVREKPVINDALKEDAFFCGIDGRAEVISSGVDAPGTVLKYCSPEFIEIFRGADMVISKGQGNYEALNEESREVFFLFRAKCPVVARNAGVDVGDIVLIDNKRKNETADCV